MTMPKVDFAIVGVPKSATTFLHGSLRSHPDVLMDENENVAFRTDDWEEKLAPLLSRVANGKHQLCGIKRPDLMFFQDALHRMKMHNPHMRIITLLRHPIERAMAHYFHLISYSYGPLEDFDTGINSLMRGVMQKDWPRMYEVLAFSEYADAMRTLIDVFGNDSVLFMTHDEVKADATTAVGAACSFLDIHTPEKVVMPTSRPQKVMYSLERLRFLRHRNEASIELDQFGRAQRFRSRARSEWEGVWARMIADFDHGLMSKHFPNVPPRLDETLWDELYDFFRSDIEQTEALLGRSMPAWHQNPLPVLEGGNQIHVLPHAVRGQQSHAPRYATQG